MNVARSPRQTYKATLFDYDELLSKSEDECCYSLSAREVQLILAQLDYISWKTRYRPTLTEISQEIIDNWQGNLARKLMSGCCPGDGTIGRFGEDGQWETSSDGGETWTPAPEDDPRNNYVGAPLLPGAPSDAKRCAAADNVAAQFLAQRDYIISLLTEGTKLIALVAGILAFLAVIAGIGGATIGISVLLMGMASALLTMTPESVEEQIDATALETFKCLVYCHMDTDGQLTYDEWLLLLQDIRNEFDAFPETFFYSTTNAWGYIGMNNAGTIGAATAADCGDCGCPGCADKYVIGPISNPTNHGLILARTATTIDVQAQNPGNGIGYIILVAETLGDCCWLNSRTPLSGGTVTANFLMNCGTPYAEGSWINATPVGGCRQAIQIQTQVGAVWRFTFDDCP